MRKLILVGLAVTFFGVTCTGAFACGDKLMLLSGMTRLRQIYSRKHPAVILAYMRENSAVPGVVKQLEREPSLKQNGYQVNTVEDDPVKLDEALKAGKYDVVMLDATDAEALELQVRSAPSMPLVLPVLYNSTKTEAKSVEKKFHVILKAPGSPDYYLAALDEAMELRLKNSLAKVSR
jgi:hypothetical protein